MLMPGIFSDTFSKFVQLVWTGVSLPIECVVLGAIYPPLKYHNRHRDRGDPIECRGMGSMVRHCICKIDFAFGTLISMLQKKATRTYIVLVNWIAMSCGCAKWWIENPTKLQKKKKRKKALHSSVFLLIGSHRLISCLLFFMS